MKNKYLTKKILTAVTAAVMIAGTVPCQAVFAEESSQEAPEIDSLTYESEMSLEYAQKFKIYNYADDYRLLDINDGTRYLVVPSDKEIPENLDSDITVLQMPLDKVYLTATSVMSLYDSLDALDQIRLSGTQANGWYIDNAVSAMETGDILFAGKYNEPDYELLISEDCDLTIESTMIFHSPKVKEMIEDLGIPVLVEYATYEPHPLGRVEWIKLYGVLTGKEKEAEERFQEQKKIVEEMNDFPNTGKTIAYFYVSSDGKVVVRDSSDYIARMIEIAGGQYIYTDLINEESSLSSVSMTLEEFYNNAINADYLVYNATIDSPISSIDDLLAKSELFADFKAVKEGNVWCNDKKMYQSVDRIGDVIRDFHLILTDGEESRMTFMKKVN
ncbi:MAG: ABC transporter substrate-binding protein [Blautia sp.]|nr:ABC transporter substrate-binding protein [Blautia sp.]MDY3998883.1 ABC transporter substrate-binding protein [Blautia sp.]